MSAPPLALSVNGRREQLGTVPADERLLDTLRWRLHLKGTKEGCRTGDCGACTVLVDGESVLSCLTLTRDVEGTSVLTIEGAASDPVGRRVQTAFEQEAGLQCGYCTPGFVMALTGLLKEHRSPVSAAALLDELQGNLCRCTGYVSIVRSVERIAEASR